MNTQTNKLRIRPRFKEVIATSVSEVKQQINSGLQNQKSICVGKIVDNHVILKIPASQQHYWSPQLTLELEAQNDQTLIRGLYGPKPGVWTMFVFFYSSIGFLTLLGLIFGLSQMMLKMNAYGLWSIPVGGGIMLGLFIISKIGQGLSNDQMHQLKDFLDSTLETNQESLDL